jgi:hypothetical protein
MMLIPAIFTLHSLRADDDLRKLVFWIVGLALVIIIGFRHEIGGDWDRYISIYDFHTGTALNFQNFKSGDYAYELIHWFSLNYLNGIYSTNLICAIFFVSGLIRLSRKMPFPWISLLISMSFLVIVVAMGYTRQGAAVGFLMWALVDLINGNTKKFYMYIIIGSLFHKTLLIMISIGYIYTFEHQNKVISFILFSLILLAGYVIFENRVQHMLYYYIEIKFHHSSGALARVTLNAVSAIIFFLYRDKFRESFHDEKLWFIFGVVSILLTPISLYYSTLSDRIAIYFLPIQMVVLSRIPILIESVYWRTIFVVCVTILYSSALFAWLFFGVNSQYWLPYQNLLTLG